jgi:hypothetical protein
MRTPIHLAVVNDGAATPAQAFQKTWAKFSGPADVNAWDGRFLYYYRDGFGFSACVYDSLAAFLTAPSGSGQCMYFALLLQEALGMNGIEPQSSTWYTGVCPSDGSQMLVKDWTFGPATYSGDVYEYAFTPNPFPLDPMVPPPTGGYGDLINNKPTLYGQHTRPPSEKLFGSHYILKVDPTIALGAGPFFDASYGVAYANATDLENQAIDGYAVPNPHSDAAAGGLMVRRTAGVPPANISLVFEPPSSPAVLESPANGATGVSAVTLTWTQAGDATLYDVWLGPTADSLSYYLTTGDRSLDLSSASLSPGTTYYWKVRKVAPIVKTILRAQ